MLLCRRNAYTLSGGSLALTGKSQGVIQSVHAAESQTPSAAHVAYYDPMAAVCCQSDIAHDCIIAAGTHQLTDGADGHHASCLAQL